MDYVDELAKRLLELGDKLGEPTARAALEAARMEAYSALASGALWMTVAVALAFGGRFMWRRGVAWKGNTYDFNAWPLAAVAVFIIAGLMFASSAWAFVDPRTWNTIAHPEVWLAKRVLGI